MSEVRFTFVASGHDSVLRAFRDISGGAKSAARDVDVAAGQMVRATDQGGSKQTRSAQRTADAMARAQERAVARSVSAADRQARAAEKGAERVAKAQERAHQRWAKAVETAVTKESAARHRQMQRDQTAGYRADARAERVRRDRLDRVGGLLGGAVLSGTALAGAAVAGTVGAAARESLSLREITTRLAINARGAGEKMADPAQMQREIEATAIKSGQSATAIGEAMQDFVAKTGDLSTARKMQDTFATTATATGADVKDIAGAGSYLMQKFDIKGVAEMQEAMAKLAFQGKAGAFELKDAASEFAELASAADNFGIGKGPEAVKTLGALAQIARQATGSSAEATTAVQAMFRQLTAKHGALEASGVQVFNDNGTGRDITQILTEAIGKVGGTDMVAKKTQLQKIFDIRGIRAINPLMSAFQDAAVNATGKDGKPASEEAKIQAGMAAVSAAIEKFRGAEGNWSDIMDDAATAQQSTSVQLQTAWEMLKNKTSEELLPQIIELVPKFAGLVDAMDPAVGVMGIFLEAVNGAADALGLIKKPSAGDKLGKAKSELEAFETTLEKKGLNATPADIAKRDKLQAAVDAAANEAFAVQDSRPGTGANNREVFGAMFGESHGFAPSSDDIYRELLSDPDKARNELTGLGASAIGISPEQQKLIEDTAERIKSQQSSTDPAKQQELSVQRGEAGVGNAGDVKAFIEAMTPGVASLEELTKQAGAAAKVLSGVKPAGMTIAGGDG